MQATRFEHKVSGAHLSLQNLAGYMNVTTDYLHSISQSKTSDLQK